MSVLSIINIEDIGSDLYSPLPQSNIEKNRKRNKQHKQIPNYRSLTSEEIKALEKNNNFSTNWNQVLVSEQFLPDQIRDSKFYGWVRIGTMSKKALSYRDLKLPTGIYNSCIVSCDIGACTAIHNVRYMAHFIIREQVILSSIDEMVTSDTAKFGNGIIREGEIKSRRIVLELCNENGRRAVIPFEGMRLGDAYIWSRHRDDQLLQNRFKKMTEKRFSKQGGEYSEVGHKTVIKNSRILKDVKIGSYAYIKGINKLKNLTIHSSSEAYTQIGEGCELVNGIIGYGCRIFYGVKAVRFILSSFSQLKYGARLINSFLGENSTISCCEVLNSLLYSGHEQHHNNSFLCASFFMGQSNMAAGATVGSNHNSRAADGELIAGRGFWPGLCVNLKHNSRFASFTLLVKGDFAYEIDLKIPFCLVSNKISDNEMHIIPGYWFLYNMYALLRNENKYKERDKRPDRTPRYEYDVLAPDTVNEMIDALQIIEYAVGKSSGMQNEDPDKIRKAGRLLLNSDKKTLDFPVILNQVEHSNRTVKLLKAKEGYTVFKRMLNYYIAKVLTDFLTDHSYKELQDKIKTFADKKRGQFINLGGQLVQESDYKKLLSDIKKDKLTSWEDIHETYCFFDSQYEENRTAHALTCLYGTDYFSKAKDSSAFFIDLIEESLITKKWMTEQIYKTRDKDYQNSFVQSMFSSKEEMDEVLGSLEDNTFIHKYNLQLDAYRRQTQLVLKKLKKSIR